MGVAPEVWVDCGSSRLKTFSPFFSWVFPKCRADWPGNRLDTCHLFWIFLRGSPQVSSRLRWQPARDLLPFLVFLRGSPQVLGRLRWQPARYLPPVFFLLTPFCLQAVNDRKNELFQKSRKAYLAQKGQLRAAIEELRRVKDALATANAKPAEVDQLRTELEETKQQLLRSQGKFWCCPLLLLFWFVSFVAG